MVRPTIAHYRVTAKLGAGGMGEVYRATDTKLGRDVALKVLPAAALSDTAARDRLLREARTASKLNHPHICTIHEVGEAEGQVYIAMELVEGQPLSARLAEGSLPTEQVLRYGSQIADALSHAHERNIIHRDLKCANVIITGEGRAKVLDFGLAKRLREDESDEVTRSQASLTKPGTVIGTLAYMAPEQLRGQPADARSDIWALGVVLYEMATGVQPFEGQTAFALSSAILNQSTPSLPARVPVELRAVIERCLDKEQARRFQRAGEVRAALEATHAGAVAPWVFWRYMLARRPWLALAAVVAVLAAVLVGLNVGKLRERLHGGAPRIESLAVLPLENLSGDAEQDYLAAGMHEALIIDLGKLNGLRRVSARPSVMRYQKTDKPLRQIAEELGVGAVITGTVMRSGDRVRITAHLINPATEEQLWADSYERELRDVLSLQNEIVAAIAREVKLQLSPREQARLASARPVNPEAYEAYLKGKFHLSKFTSEGFEKGLAYLHQAIEKDPADPLAYAGLAQGYSVVGSFSSAPPPDAMPRAKAAALKALALDETLAEAHAALAHIKLYKDWDFAGAEQGFRRALELNPNLAEAHMYYGWYLTLIGRGAEAIREMKRGIELDPLSPLYTAWLGGLYWQEGRYQEAIAQAQKSLELEPDFPVGLYVLGGAYAEKGLFREAIAAHEKAAAKYPNHRWVLARTYAQAGRTGEARKILAGLGENSRSKDSMDSWYIAEAYVALGEKEEAIQWLERAFASRQSFLPWVGSNPAFRPLHSDPRFKDLLRRMKVPH